MAKKLNGILSFAICFFIDSIKSAIKKLTETQTLFNLHATCILGSINFVHFTVSEILPVVFCNHVNYPCSTTTEVLENKTNQKQEID